MENLSLRLKTVADLVPKGAKVCDVGTDHGYLPVFLKRRGDVASVIATDINPKPLKKAEENIKLCGVKGISLRLCDGLAGVTEEEADTVIIAGMGGEVISGIIDRSLELFKGSGIMLILQPTTSPELLRKYLYKTGFEIKREIPIEENKKLYSVMECEFKGIPQEKEEWFYYAGLVSPLDFAGKLYIEKQKNRCLKCVRALENIPAKQEDYNYYKKVFSGLERRLYGV